MKFSIFVLTVFIGAQANAQEKMFVVNPGQRILDVMSLHEIYHYPSFSPGTVYFNDGATSGGLMNYNTLFGEMQFIDQKGDTLSFADMNKVRLLTINNDSFYYDHGYLQLVSSGAHYKLLQRQVVRQSSASKIGLYDQTVDGGSASSYSSISSGAHDANLVVNQKITLVKQTVYFFGDEKNHFVPASRKAAEKLFPGKKAAIAEYLSSSNTDFRNEADLKKLLAYIAVH